MSAPRDDVSNASIASAAFSSAHVVICVLTSLTFFFFFFNDPAPPEISPLPLHDALPISPRAPPVPGRGTPLDRERWSPRSCEWPRTGRSFPGRANPSGQQRTCRRAYFREDRKSVV